MTTICLRASSDTPTLYVYGELDEAARASFEEHAATCEACAAVLADLRAIRVALADRTNAARGDREWQAFMRRLEAAIDSPRERAGEDRRPRGPERSPSGWPRARVSWVAIAATLIIGIAMGLSWQRTVLGPRHRQVADAAASQAAFDTAAARHLERAKLVVLGLAMKDPGGARAQDWQYERELAASLLPETRLFRLSASDRGDSRLAGLLGDLEAVLLQAALTSDAETPELERIQRIIRGRDLIVRMDMRADNTTRGL